MFWYLKHVFSLLSRQWEEAGEDKHLCSPGPDLHVDITWCRPGQYQTSSELRYAGEAWDVAHTGVRDIDCIVTSPPPLSSTLCKLSALSGINYQLQSPASSVISHSVNVKFYNCDGWGVFWCFRTENVNHCLTTHKQSAQHHWLPVKTMKTMKTVMCSLKSAVWCEGRGEGRQGWAVS